MVDGIGFLIEKTGTGANKEIARRQRQSVFSLTPSLCVCLGGGRGADLRLTQEMDSEPPHITTPTYGSSSVSSRLFQGQLSL